MISAEFHGPRLAHLSDLHLTSLNRVRLRDLANKRVLGYLSWRFHRRTEHRREVLEALLCDLRDTKPDHVVITGDLTHVGMPGEFAEAGEWLHARWPPSRATVVPGNHDAYVSAAWDRTFALWAPYMVSDSGQPDGNAGSSLRDMFPSVRVRDATALIGISTARPSAPFLAVGTVGQAQLRKLERVLEETGRQGLFRIVLLHHSPAPGALAWRKRLTDGAELRAVLARRGAELVLHGHAHHASLARLATPHGWAPAVGVPSASAVGRKPERGARYNIYRVEHTTRGRYLLASVRGYSRAEGRFTEEGGIRLKLPGPAA